LGSFRTSAKQTLEHTSKAVALTTMVFSITQSSTYETDNCLQS